MPEPSDHRPPAPRAAGAVPPTKGAAGAHPQLEPAGLSHRLAWSGLPYLLLLASTVSYLTQTAWQPERIAITLGLVVLAAGWLLWAVRVRPSWARQRVQVITYLCGLMLITGALLTRSGDFAPFVTAGYAFMFALLPLRWLVPGAGAVAAVSVIAQNVPAWAHHDKPSPWGIAVSLAIPLLLAGWFVGVLNARQERVIAQLEETNDRLTATMAENEGLHAQLLAQAREAGVNDERQRLAGEIHDTLAQGLAGILTQLEALEHADAADGDWHGRVTRARELTRENLIEARRSVRALTPAGLAGSRLPDALRELADNWSQTSGGRASVEVYGDTAALTTAVEVTLYRVAQEALTNAAKHAGAERVGVTLSCVGDTVLLDIRDDGRGFTPGAPRDPGEGAESGFGLATMRRRLTAVGGSLDIDSTPGEGTTVNATIPVRAEGAAPAAADGGTTAEETV